MKRILILEPDPALADELAGAAAAAGDYEVTIATSLRAACLNLSATPFDLGLVGCQPGRAQSLIDALRTVQPDLRLILALPGPGWHLHPEHHQRLQGVLSLASWADELPQALAEAFEYPPPVEDDDQRERPSFDLDALSTALAEARPGGDVYGIALGWRGQPLAFAGALSRPQAALVTILTQQIGNGAAPIQLQFVRFPGATGERLLYSQHLDVGLCLTLVAAPITRVRWLRAAAEPLVKRLAPLLGYSAGEPARDASSVVAPAPVALARPSPARHSYTLFWQPVAPLPAALRPPIQRVLERLASTNGCDVHWLKVAAGHVELALTCPPGRHAAWAVNLLKRGVEAALQQRFGVTAVLWRPGHFAAEPARPLTEAELKLFSMDN